MKDWQLKGVQWGFLILLVAASPLILREVRKGGLAKLNTPPAQAQTVAIPRKDLERRYKVCNGLPRNTEIQLNDNELNNEVYACEQSRS